VNYSLRVKTDAGKTLTPPETQRQRCKAKAQNVPGSAKKSANKLDESKVAD
jgi:hypothetical protein